MSGIDIANNIKAVELIKIEIMQSLTDLFGDIISEPDSDINDKIADDAANIINLTYLLCRRIGITFEDINLKMTGKLVKGINENHNLEKKFGDLSELLEKLGYINGQQR